MIGRRGTSSRRTRSGEMGGIIAMTALVAAAALAWYEAPSGTPPRAAIFEIFAVTYLVIAIGRLPGFRLDRAGAALVGASLMLAVGGVGIDDISRVIDFDTVALLLGMMIVVGNLRLSGFFRLVTGWTVARARHPLALLATITLTSGLFSAFLLNDAICLALRDLPNWPRTIRRRGGLSRAIIRDVYDREMAARGLALVMMAMTLAPAISPALGAYLAEWFDWRAIFVLLGALGAVVFAATVIRLAETNRHPASLDVAGMARSYALLLRSPGFGGFVLCSAWHQRVVVYVHRKRALSRHRRAWRAAQHLRAHDPVPDGDLHARQCCGGEVRATRRQLAAADRRPRPGAGRRRGGDALLPLGRVQRLGLVSADRFRRDRRRLEPAFSDGRGAQHSSPDCRDRVGAHGLSANDNGRCWELCRRAAAA